MDEEELDQWEEKMGFISYRSWFNQSADEFFELKNEDEYHKWLETYKDILYVEDSVIYPLIDHGIYKNIINRTGEFMIGDNYTKVLPDRVITIRNGDRNQLTQALKIEKSTSTKTMDVLFFSQKGERDIKTRSTEVCNPDKFSNGIKVGKRKAFIEAVYVIVGIAFPPFGVSYESKVELKAHGHKKGLFGWNKYKTKIHIENVSIGANDVGGNYIVVFDDFSKTKEAREISVIKTVFQPNGEPQPEPYFSGLLWSVGKSKTRGTHPNWVSFCCQSPPTGVYCP